LQNGEGISAGIYFSTDKPVDRVHISVDRPARSVHCGPTMSWTEGGPGRDGALTGAQPPAAPVHQSSLAGAQKGERSTGSSARASPEIGRRCSDWATAVARRGHGKLGGEGFWRGRGEGCGDLWSALGHRGGFYRAGGGRREVWPE
jgi:hypothetical protein